MAWQSWTLCDWNEALVKAVFFDGDRLDRKITRIQASKKFLAQCTGDPSCDPRAAQRAFTASFGSTSSVIGRHFQWTPAVVNDTARSTRPQIFAVLYFTLLAASADEDTYTVGDFRERFVELLKPAIVARPTFGALPLLWKHVEKWSRSRAKHRGDCRVLSLPDEGRERLIGYSKRLAFPAYCDEIHLRSLLQKRGFDSNSDFRHVASAIASRLSDYSKPFLEEFSIFQALATHSRYEEAFNSPLWRAVQAITWDDEEATSQRVGSFCLGVDAADPEWPEFYLLTDEVGRGNLGNVVVCQSLSASTDYLYAAHLPNSAPWTPARLLGLASTKRRLPQARLWKHLSAGCAALFPGPQNSLSSDGSYYDGAPACLLVHEKLAPAIRRASSHFRVRPAEAKAGGSFGAWIVLFFGSISAVSMAWLADALPAAARQALPGSWRPQRISCSGGAWFGQSLLLNPASTPLFGLPGAISGSYELTSGDAAPVTGGLEEVDGKFRVPPSAAAAGTFDSAYISLATEGDAVEGMRIPLAKYIPMVPPLRLADPQAWLTDGAAGRLAGLEAVAPAERAAVAARVPALHPRFEQTELPFEAGTECLDLDGVPDPLGWLREALALRFQRRQTLAHADLSSHLQPACTAAGARYWEVRNLLFSAGWIIQLQKRSSPHPMVAAAPRTIALHGTTGGMHTARIVGMFPDSECALLRASLCPAESAVRLAPAGNLLGIGAIQLQLTSEARLTELAAQFELEILGNVSGVPPLFLPPKVFELDRGASDDMRSARDAEAWDPSRHLWTPAGSLEIAPVPGTIVRISRQQRRAFWIAAPGGWLETDSEAWAFMLGLAAEGKTLGAIDAAGNCWLSGRLGRLPLPLVRWWMHWGGGCAALAPSGEIVLANGTGPSAWNDLRGWFAAHAAVPPSQQRHDAALERRALALRLRKAQQPAGF
jgi:hypothetical protein